MNRCRQALAQHQLGVCWGLFSEKSQKEFLNWTLKDLYAQNNKAATAAKLGIAEVKLMFETNNLDLILRFWRRLLRQSRAGDFNRYGYYSLLENRGKTAIVEVRLIFDNGQEQKVQLTMVNERGGWRFGYLESGLPF